MMSAAAIKFICLGLLIGAVGTYFFLSAQIQKRRKAERHLRLEIERETENFEAEVASLTEQHAVELKKREVDQKTLQETFQSVAGAQLQAMIQSFQAELQSRWREVTTEQAKVIDHNGEKVLDSYNSLGRLFLQAQEKLEALQVKSESSLQNVEQHIAALQKQEAELVQETVNLRRSLRSENQELGRNWGELKLQTLFQQGGLQENFDFEEVQVPVKGISFEANPTESLMLYAVHLKGGRSLFVDCHHGLLAYFKDVLEVGEAEREVAERVLQKALERRVELLLHESVRERTQAGSPFIFCFVGSEALMEFLVQKNFMLLESSRKQGVLFVGPTQFLPLLQILSWGQQSVENYERSRELLGLSQELATSMNQFVQKISALRHDSHALTERFSEIIDEDWSGAQGVLPVLTKMAYLQKRESEELFGAMKKGPGTRAS